MLALWLATGVLAQPSATPAPAPPPFYPGHGNGNGFPEHQSAFDAELALLVRNRETVLQFVQFICATDLLDS
jgi:hypothetical protein